MTDACTDRHRHQEFLAFLQQVAAAYPRRKLHVVVDNLSTHSHPVVRAWLERHRRVRLHFTPTSGSWLNLVERWFAELTTKWLRRGTHRSVAELEQSIQSWIDTWNQDPRPFVWHKTADEILEALAAYCQRISGSGH